jgi:uncharacterized protein (DUF1697 family)
MATTTQIALLRGINVGRNKRLPMGRLRELLGELGYADVRTHLQSGNAILTSGKRPDRVAREIAQGIEREFGFDVEVVVRTRDELDAVIAGNPMPEHTDQPAKLLVAFLSAAPKAERVKKLDPAEFAPDEIHFSGRHAYLWYPKGVIDAKIGPTFWEKHVGVSATTRNWTTVTKLASLAA